MNTCSVLQLNVTVSLFRSHLQVSLVCARHPRNAMASEFPLALFLYMWCTILAASCADTTTVAFDAQQS